MCPIPPGPGEWSSNALDFQHRQTISDSTRRRVLDAAARLGYTPSAAARTLKRGRSGVVLYNLEALATRLGLGTAADRAYCGLQRGGPDSGDAHRRGGGRGVEAAWSDIAPAAVLSYTFVDPNSERVMRTAGVQCVAVLFSGESDGSARFVRPDSRIGRLQAEHLIAAGHTRIGYAYPEPPLLRDFAEPRLEGVRAACADAGIAAPEVRTVPLDAQFAAAAIEHWRGLDDPMTAICPYVAEARRIVHEVTSALHEGAAPEATDPADLFTTVVRESA